VAKVIHVFHGFLGSPEDFSFLKQDGLILHDLCLMESFPTIHPDDTLIGYSMGGRVALEIAQTHDYKLKKIILLNSHPGLPSEEERQARKELEDQIFQKLQENTQQEFLNYWNALPLFSHDKPIGLLNPDRYLKFVTLFDRFRLSQQRNHLPQMQKHTDKVLWIVGLEDEKYMNIASEFLLTHDISVKGMRGGHRLFQKPEELKQLLVDEGIL
jgi:2-succinyl-6-hydroxy-2,4-cyclohexadiene-1-carboxylate synthase